MSPPVPVDLFAVIQSFVFPFSEALLVITIKCTYRLFLKDLIVSHSNNIPSIPIYNL